MHFPIFNRSSAWLLVLASIALPVAAQTAVADYPERPYRVTEERQPCDHYSPERQVFWGDTHAHSSFSIDAGVQGTRNTPDDAYRYGKGARVGLQPYDSEGKPRRTARISEPLDFVAVTDHGEALGMVGVCTTPGYAGYNSFICRTFRNYPRLGFLLMIRLPSSGRALAKRYDYLFFLARGTAPGDGLPAFCGTDGKDCQQAGLNLWNEIQQAAERAYDRSSACTFTSFVAYEWTGNSDVNLHRNVIFRNERVTPYAISYVQEETPEKLWAALDKACLQTGKGCDVLAIPHNSNLSGGQMFPSIERLPLSYTAADALFRRRIEPLVEVMQHKGDSECYYAPGMADELCAFEKLPYSLFSGKFFRPLALPPNPGDGYIRDVLKEGLKIHARLNENPYEIGILAATDTHLGTPGAVEEWQHQGHGGAGIAATSELPKGLPDDPEYNPGGLAGVWAEENSRDSLFAAMRRREVFGTSGPRIRLRMFGGWDYPQELCESADFAAHGYRDGVPMGGTLRGGKLGAEAPSFAIQALRAAGVGNRSGTPLQRLQIIKGWIDSTGKRHEKVYDIAGDPDNGAGVDTRSCEERGSGFDRLCTVWKDPDFRPGEGAFYYARAVENPSCRWSKQICLKNNVNCSDPSTVGRDFEFCCSGKEHRRTVQERAWSSPIWYYPAAKAAGSTALLQ